MLDSKNLNKELVDFAEFLKQRRFDVHPQRIINAIKVLSLHKSLNAQGIINNDDAVQFLVPILTPIFCSTSEQKNILPDLLTEWLKKDTSKKPSIDPTDQPFAETKKFPFYFTRGKNKIFLLLGILAGFLFAAWFYYCAENTFSISTNNASTPVKIVDTQNKSTVFAPDKNGAIHLSISRQKLPLKIDYGDVQPFILSALPDEGEIIKLPQITTPPKNPEIVSPQPAPGRENEIPFLTQKNDSFLPWNVFTLILLLGILGFYFFYINPKVKHYLVDTTKRENDEKHTLKPTYLPKETQNIILYKLRSLPYQLQKRVEVPSLRFNHTASINATIQAGGFPKLINAYDHIKRDYVVLIERVSKEDHLAWVADNIVTALFKDGVDLHRYVFRDNPKRSYHEKFLREPKQQHHGPHTLDQLRLRHPHAGLVIISDGRCLINRDTGQPVDWISELLQWDHPVLITPTPGKSWSVREWLLVKTGLRVVPMDSEGLGSLASNLTEAELSTRVDDAISKEQRPVYQRDWGRLLDPIPPGKEFVDRLVNKLKNDLARLDDLDNKGVSFAWLCGCAMYPEVRPDLTLKIGRFFIGQDEKDKKEQEKYLRTFIKLAEFPWLRNGYFPYWLRKALYDKLERKYEKPIRTGFENLLKEMKLSSEGTTEIHSRKGLDLGRIKTIFSSSYTKNEENKVFIKLMVKPFSWMIEATPLRNIIPKKNERFVRLIFLLLISAFIVFLLTRIINSLDKPHNPNPIVEITGHTDLVLSVAFSPDGSRIVSGSKDTTVRLWNTQTGQPIGSYLSGHTGWVWGVAFSPDGSRIVSCAGSGDKTLRQWDVKTGQAIGQPLTGHTAGVVAVAYSPDGSRIVSASDDGTLRLWNTQTGQPIGQEFKGHTSIVHAVAFSPDGNTVVSASTDRTLRIWDVKTGMPIGSPFTGHTDRVLSVAFSPDGEKIISGSRDRTVRLWNARTGQPIGKLLEDSHSDTVTATVFSRPEGKKTAVSSGLDKRMLVWDTQTGVLLGQAWVPHPTAVRSMAVSPDGSRIVTGSEDGKLRVWEAW